jgi:hypothetical protein
MRWTFKIRKVMNMRGGKRSNKERRRRSVVNVKGIISILKRNVKRKKKSRARNILMVIQKKKQRYEPDLCK